MRRKFLSFLIIFLFLFVSLSEAKTSGSSTSWGGKSSTSSVAKPSKASTPWGGKTNTAPSDNPRQDFFKNESKAKAVQDNTSDSTKTDSQSSRSADDKSNKTTPTPSGGKTNSTQNDSPRAAFMKNESKARAVQDNSVKPISESGYTPVVKAPQIPEQQRTVIIKTYHNSYGGYYYNDPWNHYRIFDFSDLWWYHHWNSIDKSYYADDPRFHNIESRVRLLEAQNIARDSNYRDQGMNDTVLYGDGYRHAHKTIHVFIYIFMFLLIVILARFV
jgi:hypothetical protein